MLSFIRSSTQRMESVRAGAELRIEEKGITDCLNWSIQYAIHHDASLATEIMDTLSADLEAHAALVKRL